MATIGPDSKDICSLVQSSGAQIVLADQGAKDQPSYRMIQSINADALSSKQRRATKQLELLERLQRLEQASFK
jgi:hypothetical protein